MMLNNRKLWRWEVMVRHPENDGGFLILRTHKLPGCCHFFPFSVGEKQIPIQRESFTLMTQVSWLVDGGRLAESSVS